MHHYNSSNQPRYVHDSTGTVPISNLFDLRRDKPESSRGYNDVFESAGTSSYSDSQGSFKESQADQHGTPVLEGELFFSGLNCNSKYSPAWKFLKQFNNSPDSEKMNPPNKNICHLFDLPHDDKFGIEPINRIGNECSFDVEDLKVKDNPFPNRGSSNNFGFHKYQLEHFTPKSKSVLYRNRNNPYREHIVQNRRDNQNIRVNKMQPNSLSGSNKVSKVRPPGKLETTKKKAAFYRSRRRKKLKNTST